MSKICELTKIKALRGNNVSHSNRKTKRIFSPNLQRKKFNSKITGACFTLRISTSAIRTIDLKHGVDNYLLETKNEKLSKKALKIKKAIQKRKNTLKNKIKE